MKQQRKHEISFNQNSRKPKDSANAERQKRKEKCVECAFLTEQKRRATPFIKRI